MTFLASMAAVTFETMPNEMREYSSLCWFFSRMRESMDGLKDLSGPTMQDDGPVLSSGGVTKNGKFLEGTSARQRLVLEVL